MKVTASKRLREMLSSQDGRKALRQAVSKGGTQEVRVAGRRYIVKTAPSSKQAQTPQQA
jgi:hypothetical protein